MWPALLLRVAAAQQEHGHWRPKTVLREAENLAAHHAYLQLLVGEEHEADFARCHSAMAQLAASQWTGRSSVFYAAVKVIDDPGAQLRLALQRLPAVLHYHHGARVATDYEFERKGNPLLDLQIKAVRAVSIRAKSPAAFAQQLQAREYSLVYDAEELSGEEQREVLLGLHRLFFSLSAVEYQLVAASPAAREQSGSIDFNGQLTLHCRETGATASLPLNELRGGDLARLRQWVAYSTHEAVLPPQRTYKQIIELNQWAMVLFVDSGDAAGEARTAQGVTEFHAAAREAQSAMIFCVCDLATEEPCTALRGVFELEELALPFARVLYASPGKHAVQHHAFKFLPDRGQGDDFALSREGVLALLADFKAMKVDLEVRSQPDPPATLAFFERGIVSAAPLVLNSRLLGTFFARDGSDRLVLVYDSTAGQNERSMEELVAWLPASLREGRLFAVYDVARNSRRRLGALPHLPLLRVFRKEDSSRGHFVDRTGVTSPRALLFGFVDLLFEDHLLPDWPAETPSASKA